MDDTVQLKGEYRGVVAENDDPDKDRRLKVRVEPLHGDIPTSDLPWAIPSDSSGLATGGSEGSSTDYGKGGVPYTGSKVIVEFEDGDPLEPIWKRKSEDKQQSPKRFRGDQDQAYDTIENNRIGPEPGTEIPEYPDGRGWVLKNGSVMELSDDGRYLVHTANGYRCEVKQNGVVITHADDDEYRVVAGNLDEYVDGDKTDEVTGDKTETVSGDIEKSAGTYLLESSGVSLELSNGQVQIGGGSMVALVKRTVKSLLNNHQHIGNQGSPTSNPITPIVQTTNITEDTVAS